MSALSFRRPVAVVLATVVCLLVTGFAGCAPETPAEPIVSTPQQVAFDPIERGRYLVTLTGCGDCHTPLKMGENGPEPDTALFLAGHPESLEMPAPPALEGPWVWAGAGTNTAFVGPWGVTYAANLTPDENTGLGIWTEEMFVQAMRTGRHMGQSRPIQPPMPWPGYAQATDEDLQAIYAYLRSLKPIENRVPEYRSPSQGADQAAG